MKKQWQRQIDFFIPDVTSSPLKPFSQLFLFFVGTIELTWLVIILPFI
jgi:hypothetical protein